MEHGSEKEKIQDQEEKQEREKLKGRDEVRRRQRQERLHELRGGQHLSWVMLDRMNPAVDEMDRQAMPGHRDAGMFSKDG